MSVKGYKKIIEYQLLECYEQEEAFEFFKVAAKFMAILSNNVRSGYGLRESSDSYSFWYYPHIQKDYMLRRIEEFEKVISLAGVEYTKVTKYRKPIWKH